MSPQSEYFGNMRNRDMTYIDAEHDSEEKT